MQPLIAITTLLLWSSCYLNCSTGLFGELAEFFGDSEPHQSCSSCPQDQEERNHPEDDDSNCPDRGVVIAGCDSKPFTPEPGEEYAAANDLLAELVASLKAARSAASALPRYSEAQSPLSEQLHAHIARPIRGPAA